MKTTSKSLVNAVVVLDAEYAAFFAPSLANVLCLVCDCRLQGGSYTYTIAPILEVGVDSARARTEMSPDEFRVVEYARAS